MLPGYEVLDHKSSVELKIHARDWPELLVEAGHALSAHLWGLATTASRGPATWHHVQLRAPDRAALLAQWLNELLFEAEAGWWVPVEFVVEDAASVYLDARVRCVTVDEAPPPFQAVQPHDVQVVPAVGGGFEATVILAMSSGQCACEA
jgi:SHS2 domain-containing protein